MKLPLFKKKPAPPVLKAQGLGMHWDAEDPFLFASHHSDDYPAGNAQQAPPLRQISGRNLGRDYQKLFGFRMYHGKVVPGFPLHSHWGYETVTVPEKGFVDHFDSLGNCGRFGFGDVQWVSAGSLYSHDEMYPLAFDDRPNPNDITQIMIDLPSSSKGSAPAVSTVWAEDVPVVELEGCEVKVVAGSFGGASAAAPHPGSWAADPAHGVRILRIAMRPGASLDVDGAAPGARRNLYFVSGADASIGGEAYGSGQRLKMDGSAFRVENGGAESAMWLLEGVPIGERRAAFGPVALGTDREVLDAMNEIRRRELADWPWGLVDRTQPKGAERFLARADGSTERPVRRSS
ncbi:MAG: pirin family protein [Candidatus Methanoplasma sp.]|jgi:redox-sensitive bicupin YhaK (pirin superfamily)|nr:pirin family protein [Candidatus Methanoplasma sp.]